MLRIAAGIAGTHIYLTCHVPKSSVSKYLPPPIEGLKMSDRPSTTIVAAEFPQDLDVVSSLFTAYATSLGIDLSFQNFDAEFSSLPGKYALTNGGALLLAKSISGDVLGCVALRSLNPPYCCEMKRLYVSPNSRGTGAGRMLIERVIQCAKEMGYREVRLDTLPSMIEAQALYKRYGFREIEPYYDTPIAGTVFLTLDLENN